MAPQRKQNTLADHIAFYFTYILLANTVSIVWVLQFTLAVVSCSSVHPPIYISIHSLTHQHTCLAIYLSSNLLSTHTTTYSSKHPPTHPQTNTTTQSIQTSIYHPTLLPCNHLPPFTHPLTYPSILSRTHFIGCIAQRVLSPFHTSVQTLSVVSAELQPLLQLLCFRSSWLK